MASHEPVEVRAGTRHRGLRRLCSALDGPSGEIGHAPADGSDSDRHVHSGEW